MPGEIMPLEEMRQRLLGALEVGVAHGAIHVRDAASFLAPKLTDELAADIQANRTNRSGNTVTSRVHTQSEDYYGIFNEKKDWYHHRTGEAHFMANGLLGSIPEFTAEVRDAVRGVE